jgi:uncharacterized damage-inducible protein DinB
MENTFMEIKKDLLEPVAGYPREIGYYLGAWEKARAQTRKLLEDLTPEEIARRVWPGVHSIGAIALHLGEAEFYWMQEVVSEREITDEDKKLAHWLDTMETDFDKGYTAQYCTRNIDRISQMTRELLKNYTDEDLDRLHIREYQFAKTELSLRSIIQRLVDHEAHHRGQIAMIKRLLRAGDPSS